MQTVIYREDDVLAIFKKKNKEELEAKANSVLTESLTNQVLQKQWIEKWDGKLPQYQGGNANPIINLE